MTIEELREGLRALETRVTKLERSTVSGVPELSIAARFTALHDRIDVVAGNLRAHISSEITGVRTELRETAGRLNARMDTLESAMNQRIDTLESSVNQRIDTLESAMNQRFAALETSVGEILTLLRSVAGQN